jgi:hypothetical protein
MAVQKHDKRRIRLAKGTARSLGKVKNQAIAWDQVCEMLGDVVRSGEKFKEYEKMSADERNKLKGSNGWLLGGHCDGGHRSKDSIEERDVLTFDLDDATQGHLDDLRQGVSPISRFEFFWHTTRSHTADSPRIRIFVPLTEPIPASQYDAIARIFAHKIDPTMDAIDPVSFRVAQLMYLPTASKDGEFLSDRNRGELLDAQALLDDWPAWEDYTKLPFSEARGMQRPSAKKAKNPHEKGGLIGAF